MARYTDTVITRIGREERRMLDELRRIEANESELIRQSIKQFWKEFKTNDFKDLEDLI